MPKNKKSYFNPKWLSKDDYKLWISSVEQNNSAVYCKLCTKTFELSNMGEKALVSHMNGKKHKTAVETSQNLPNLFSYYSVNERSRKYI